MEGVGRVTNASIGVYGRTCGRSGRRCAGAGDVRARAPSGRGGCRAHQAAFASGGGLPALSRRAWDHRERSRVVARAEDDGVSPTSSETLEGTVGGTSGLKLVGVAKAFKQNQLLRDVSWEVRKGERVGLVGVNGAGKSTLLKIITGEIEPDEGEVLLAKRQMNVAYLTQEFEVDPRRTVREEFLSVYGEQIEIAKEIERIQTELESATDDMERMGDLLDTLSQLQAKAETLDLSTLDMSIDKMMPELGFGPDDNDRLVASYSGGWQMRMSLGKILLRDPDILLLDEPTNHLDLETISWLEAYLKKSSVPMVIVSHDRMFLDQLCTNIVELERGYATEYKGNYSEYVSQKQKKSMEQQLAYDKQQKEAKRLKEMIMRLSGGGQSGRAESAKKELSRLMEDAVEKPFEAKSRHFAFPSTERCGKLVLQVAGLTHGYNGRTLYEDTGVTVEKGERIAIVGPNGSGKSTLLRIVMGMEEAVKGEARLGSHNVVPNYFVQNQAEDLDPNLTALETLVEASPDAKLNDLKALLGKMMFSGEAMNRKAGVLSGGEKARLALAKFMTTPASLLVLDEPTNHLDIPSKEMLEQACQHFEGAVIAVSHDRYFLRKIATRVLEIRDKKIVNYDGDYDVFLEKNEEAAEAEEERSKKIKEVEQNMTKAKSKVSKAEKRMLKKQKAKQFAAQGQKKASKNAKRWN